MADDSFKPMTDQDAVPTIGDALQPADPLKGPTEGSTGNAAFSGAKQTLSDNVTKLKSEAGDRARTIADEGKARASGALEQLSQMLTDAAGQVDEKLGEQYGQYARSAATSVQGFSSTLNDKTVDDLLDDARELVRKSPAIAIGTAAAVGFVVARLLSAGLDQRDKA